jgi:hypothetical protein
MPCLLCGLGRSCGGTEAIRPSILLSGLMWQIRQHAYGLRGMRSLVSIAYAAYHIRGSRECLMSEFVPGSLP